MNQPLSSLFRKEPLLDAQGTPVVEGDAPKLATRARDLSESDVRAMIAAAKASFGTKNAPAVADAVAWIRLRADLLTSATSDQGLRYAGSPSRHGTSAAAREEADKLLQERATHGTRTYSDVIDALVRIRAKGSFDAAASVLRVTSVRTALSSLAAKARKSGLSAYRAQTWTKEEPYRIAERLRDAIAAACDSETGWQAALAKGPSVISRSERTDMPSLVSDLSGFADDLRSVQASGRVEEFSLQVLRLVASLAMGFDLAAREYIRLSARFRGPEDAARAVAIRVSDAIRTLGSAAAELEKKASCGWLASLTCGENMRERFDRCADEVQALIVREYSGSVADFFARNQGGKETFYRALGMLAGDALARGQSALGTAVPDYEHHLADILGGKFSVASLDMHPELACDPALRGAFAKLLEQAFKTHRDVREFLVEHDRAHEASAVRQKVSA